MEPILTFGYLLDHTAAIMHRQSDQILQERLGIGMSQFKILRQLQEHPNMQQRAIADLLGQTEASVSRQIKLLCEKSMLVVEVNPKNRREHLTKPTAKGLKLTQAALDILREYHLPIFNQLSDKEKEQLIDMMHKVHVEVCGPRKPIACDRPFEL